MAEHTCATEIRWKMHQHREPEVNALPNRTCGQGAVVKSDEPDLTVEKAAPIPIDDKRFTDKGGASNQINRKGLDFPL